MDWNLILQEYEQWVSDTPTVFNVNTGTSTDGTVVPNLNAVVEALDQIFQTDATLGYVLKVANKKSLDSFIAWLVYVKQI